MTTTTQLREWWAPACSGPLTKVALHGDGFVSVRSAIVDAVHALNACLAAYDYRTRLADTGAYNCRKITGGTRYSLHAYGTAVDLNWQTNPYGPVLVTDMPPAMVEAIKRIRTRNGKQVWRWGGNYGGNKDAMHYEVTCHPADLETGLDPSTIPNGEEADDVALTPEQEKALKLIPAVHMLATQTNTNVARLAGIVAELAEDVPDNIADEIDEIRRNVRKVGDAVGAEVEQ